MEMAYGMDISSKEDRFLRAAVEALDLTNRAMIPGAFLVDIVPIRASHEASNHAKWLNLQLILVKHVPDWFPGTGFKTFAKVARRKLDAVVNEPIEHVKGSMKVSLASRFPQCRG
jgi:hypothetical protein